MMLIPSRAAKMTDKYGIRSGGNDMNILETRVTNLENVVNAVHVDVATIKAQIPSLATKEQVASLEVQMPYLATKEQLAALEVQMPYLATKEQLASLEVQMPYLATKEQLASLEGNMKAFEHRIDGRMDVLEQRFDAVEQRFDAVEQRFDTLDKRCDTFATKEYVHAEIHKSANSVKRMQLMMGALLSALIILARPDSLTYLASLFR